MLIRAKRCPIILLRPPLGQIYDPRDGTEQQLEIDVVGEYQLQTLTLILTARDVFSWYFFAIPLRQPSTSTVNHALVQIFAELAYVQKHILTDKRSAFSAQILKKLLNDSGIKINHATLKHAQIIAMLERNNQKHKPSFRLK